MPEFNNRQLYRSLEGLSTKASNSVITKNTYLINKSRTYKFFYKESNTMLPPDLAAKGVSEIVPRGNMLK